MWMLYAAGSAVFAGLTAILAKVGIRHTPSNLATAIRTIVVLAFAWLVVFIVGSQNTIGGLSGPTLWFLVLSGLATGARRTVTVWHIDWIRTARWPASRPPPLRSGWRRCWRFRLGHTPIPAPRSDRWSST